MQVKLMDILTVRKGIICHQINPWKMGAGLALAIRKRYPQHYEDFEDWKKYRTGDPTGYVLFTQLDVGFVVAGLCAQPRYGRGAGIAYTNYRALGECFDKVYEYTQKHGIEPVYIPWKIGCGLGGGLWHIVEDIIEAHLPDAILCKLGG